MWMLMQWRQGFENSTLHLGSQFLPTRQEFTSWLPKGRSLRATPHPLDIKQPMVRSSSTFRQKTDGLHKCPHWSIGKPTGLHSTHELTREPILLNWSMAFCRRLNRYIDTIRFVTHALGVKMQWKTGFIFSYVNMLPVKNGESNSWNIWSAKEKSLTLVRSSSRYSWTRWGAGSRDQTMIIILILDNTPQRSAGSYTIKIWLDGNKSSWDGSAQHGAMCRMTFTPEKYSLMTLRNDERVNDGKFRSLVSFGSNGDFFGPSGTTLYMARMKHNNRGHWLKPSVATFMM